MSTATITKIVKHLPNGGRPLQTIPFKDKDRNWFIQNIEWIDGISGRLGSAIRSSMMNKIENFDLWDGIIDINKMMKLFDPDSINDGTTSSSFQHHSNFNSKFNVLIGEELLRDFTPVVMVLNQTDINQKLEEMTELLHAKIKEVISNPELKDEERTALLDKFRTTLKTSFLSQKEIRANKILNWLTREHAFRKHFNNGFKNVLICAEESYDLTPIGSRFNIETLNPKSVFCFLGGNSNKIEDSDVIVIQNYASFSQLIDKYHSVLEEEEVKDLEERQIYVTGGSSDPYVGGLNKLDPPILLNQSGKIIDDLINLSNVGVNDRSFGAPINESGEYRELIVYWKGKKQMQYVTFPNPITGEENSKYMPMNYVIDKDAGENSKIEWVNHWYKGVKIGDDLYCHLKPLEFQFEKMDNISVCYPPIVGTIYNTNDGVAVSLLDRVKSYVYFHNIVLDRLRDALVNWTRPMTELDESKKPKDFSREKWLFYGKRTGFLPTNSFNANSEGFGKGTLAGNFNNSGRTYYQDISNYVNQLINIVDLVDIQIALITGVTRQREGNIQNRETKGGVEIAVTQSSAITEPLYMQHEDTILRVCDRAIEIAKHIYKGNKFQAQYILDDGSKELFEIDGDDFSDSDYGVHVVSNRHVAELKQNITGLAQAAMQNDKVMLGAMIKMFATASIAEKTAILLSEDERIQEQLQKEYQQKQEMVNQQIESEQLLKDKQTAADWKESVLKSTTEIEKAYIMAEFAGNVDNEKDIENVMKKRDKLIQDMEKLDREISVRKDVLDNIKRKSSPNGK